MSISSARWSLFALAWLAACSGKVDDVDTADGADGDDGGAVAQPDPLVEPSGACPDLSQSGSLQIESSGETRDFTLLLPDPMPEAPGLVFFFHGIANVGSDPAAQTARSLQLQAAADELGVILVLPVAPVQNLAGIEFHLWDIALETGTDLVLYDDLRTCLSRAHPVDLERVVATGFSGGALFTTVVGANRPGTLAALVEGSGGADIEVPIYDNLASEWFSSEFTFPTLLVTGGDSDKWPNESLTIVDFVLATDTLQAHLVAEEHLVARCDHGRGHTLTQDTFELMIRWSTEHRFGQPSPWETGEASLIPDICEFPEG